MMALDTAEERFLLDAGTDTAPYPAWSPDGRKITFVRDPSLANHVEGCGDLFLMDADGGNLTSLDIGAGVACPPLVWEP